MLTACLLVYRGCASGTGWISDSDFTSLERSLGCHRETPQVTLPEGEVALQPTVMDCLVFGMKVKLGSVTD